MKDVCPVCKLDVLSVAEQLTQPATKSCANPACGLHDIPLTEKQIACIADDISELCSQSYAEGYDDCLYGR